MARQVQGALAALGRLILTLAVGGAFAGVASAQPAPRLFVSTSAQEPAAVDQNAVGRVDAFLRPNAEQKLYVYAENPTADPVNVVVKFSNAAFPDGVFSKPTDVKAGQRELIRFPVTEAPPAAPAAAPPAGAKEPAAPSTPPGQALGGPPFDVGLALFDAKDRRHALGSPLVIRGILAPHEYLDASGTYTPATRELRVQIETKRGFVGKDSVVRLGLPPARIPGLLPAKKIKDAVLEGTLSGVAGSTAILSARAFRKEEPGTGYVYVAVDGYDRAFVFDTDFTGGNLRKSEVAALRIDARPYSLPVLEFPVRLEVDNVQHALEDSVEVGIYHFDNTGRVVLEPDVLKKLPPGDREQHAWVESSKDGALIFRTRVQDWQVKLDAKGQLGKRELRASLRRQNEKVDVLDTAGKSVKDVDLINDDLTGLPYPGVVFDDSPPENVVITAQPSGAVRGGSVQLRALGEDSDSGIERVQFFVGKVTEDDKPPADAKLFDGVAPTKTEPAWTFKLPIPKTAEGPFYVGAVFTNRVGLKHCAEAMLEVTDASTGAATGPKTGTIKGVVTWGGRQSLPDLDVVLSDDKGAEKKRVKSDKDGAFVFADVDPGKYAVSSAKEESGAPVKDHVAVTVEAGKTVETKLELLRKP